MKKLTISILGIIIIIIISLLFLFLTESGESIRKKLLTSVEVKSNSLEIFSWWTAGGESEGLKELFKQFKKTNPGVEVVNATIVGGSGTKAQTVLYTRMKSDTPPDSFQVLAGPEFIETWVETGFLEPLTFLYEKNNWLKLFSRDVLNRITHDGEIYAVPLNIHRGNLIWYNLSIFRKYDLSPPETMEDLFNIAEILAENGITPLALGDKNIWPALGIFENTVISHLGPDGYSSLWENPDLWETDKLTFILKDFLKIIEYTNSDHAALTWDESVQYVIDGKCAMISIGDFAEGYFRSEGFMPEKNFQWFPYPGTKGIFSLISDVFTLPENAVNRENALQWLNLIGSKEGQDIFNPIKGSLSPRLDSDITMYHGYLQYSKKSYSSDKIVGSFTHGAEINDHWKMQISEIIHKLMIDNNIQKAIIQLQNAAADQLSLQ